MVAFAEAARLLDELVSSFSFLHFIKLITMEAPFGLQEFSEDERLAIQALLERQLGANELLWRPGPDNSIFHS